MKNYTCKLSYLALAITSALASQAATAAQDDTTKAQAGLERIEITARKAVESLQEVPVAVTSISADELTEKGIQVITEVQQFSPNTTLQRSRGTNSTITAFIRGVGQQDPLWGYEPGVGIYVDDVYIARPQGAVLDLLDIERVEVLRGPQGTLYGKNTIGGAIKYVTKEMSGDAEFNLQGTLGSFNQQDIKFTGQIPLIDDKLYLGFGVASLQRDGYGEFLLSDLPNQNAENYNKDVTAGRITLEYHATDDLFFSLNYDKTEDESNSKGGYRLLPSLLTQAPVPDSVYDSYTSMPTWNKVELEGLSFKANWTLSDATSLKYVYSSRESYSPTNIDFDNTPLRIFDVPAIYDDEQQTHEIQVNHTGDNFKLVSGLYYYDGDSCGKFDAILEELGQALGLPGLTREVSGCSVSKSTAAYAQLTYDLSEQWSVTAGARYTKDKKDATVNNGVVYETLYPESEWVPGYVRPSGDLVPEVLNDSEDWSKFTPRIGVEYQANDDLMFFASFAQGFKSGTFNPRATGPEPAANPEDVDSIELGMKSEWLENRLRANVTLFSLDHTDRQYVGYVQSDDASELNQFLSNIGSSDATGLEAEFTYLATDALMVNASFGYIDSTFKEVFERDPVTGALVDKSDTFTISNTPKYTANLAANYTIESSVGDFIVNASYYYRDDYALFEEASLLQQEGYGIANLSVSWYNNEGDLNIGLHVKNLSDEEYMVGGYQFVGVNDDGSYVPGLGGDNTLISYYGDPRTVSLTVSYQF